MALRQRFILIVRRLDAPTREFMALFLCSINIITYVSGLVCAHARTLLRTQMYMRTLTRTRARTSKRAWVCFVH